MMRSRGLSQHTSRASRNQAVAPAGALSYCCRMFGIMKRTMKTMTPSGGVPRVCAC